MAAKGVENGCEDAGGEWFGKSVLKGKEKSECQDRAIACGDLLSKSTNSRSAVEAVLGPLPSPVALFAVFDGHAGAECSSYLANHTVRQFWASAAKVVGQNKTVDSFLPAVLKDLCAALEDAFNLQFKMAGRRDGSTGNFLLQWGSKLVCANVGDTRAIVVTTSGIIPLSRDHKPTDPDERARIMKAGGTIEIDRRSNEARISAGNIAVSRAFGNTPIKKSYSNQLIATPEVTVLDMTAEMQCVVVASDGIWCRLSSEEAGTVVQGELARSHNSLGAAQALIAEAHRLKTNDDCAVVVLRLNV